MTAPIIREATGADDLAAAAAAFREYAASLPAEAHRQASMADAASLPGSYGRPGGALLLAWNEAGEVCGCVALRRLAQGVCEMKRLYVRPHAQGTGLGRRLAEAALAAAAGLGYREIRLDTLPTMATAQALYGRLGFRRVAAYGPDPTGELLFFARELAP